MSVTIQKLCSVCHRMKPCIHNKLQRAAYDRVRGHSAARLYDYRWKRARLHFLREHTQCIECLARGIITRATVVDHRIPHNGDTVAFWDETNWQPLCASHHNEKTRRDAASKRRGVS